MRLYSAHPLMRKTDEADRSSTLRTKVTACLWLLFLIGYLGPAYADDDAVVIRAGHLVDTEHGRVLEPQVILVQGGRIAEVGSQIAVPVGAKVVDLSAYTVLPGLIDAHTHLTIDQANQDPLAELEHTAV